MECFRFRSSISKYNRRFVTRRKPDLLKSIKSTAGYKTYESDIPKRVFTYSSRRLNEDYISHRIFMFVVLNVISSAHFGSDASF